MIPVALPLVSAASAAVGGPSAATAARSAASIAGSGLAGSGTGDSFSSLLASFTQNTVDTVKGAERMSIAGLEGRASTQSVVEAIMNAQESLSTALAVRDKAVNAFQDISKMPI